MRGTGALLAASLAGAAVLTGCGSTAPAAGTSAQAGPGAQVTGALGVPSTAGYSAADHPGSSAATAALAAGATGATAGGAGAQQPVGTGASGGSATALRLGPGVTATTITIGMTVQQNDAAVSSLAASYNVQLADNRGAYDALIHYINTHGGVAGRRLRPVYYTYDPTSGTADQIGQAGCSAFTEDAQVFAALDTFTEGPFDTCMQQRGRLMFPYGLFFGSQASWQRYPDVIAADGLSYDDGGRILAEHLAGTGFLSPSTHLGAIVRSSADLTEAYQRGFLPALARHGLRVAQTQFIRDPQSESDLGGYSADISSAVLKFRSSGVDRVVFFDTGSYAALVFSQNAEQQKYYPRYGFMSLNGIVSLQGSGSAAPQDQMVGAQGVSWEMNADGLTTSRTSSGRLCDAILNGAGIKATDATTEASYLKTCQTFFLFTTAAQQAGRALTRDSLLTAVEQLGSSFVATNTWGGLTRFGVGDHRGVAVYRPFEYRTACSCFAVTGGPEPVGARA